ncbi:MAG TPA: aminopeptidase P family protein [Lactobacillaceae bacterium]|jgi:Xaa-Pro aminopeptidase
MTAVYEARLAKLQKFLGALDVDGLLIYQGFNTNYLVGFDGGTGDGVVVVGKNKVRLITDARYEEAFKDNLPAGVQFDVTRDYFGHAAQAAKDFGIKVLGFEADLPYALWDQLDEILPVSVDLKPVPGAVEALREVKDDTELAALRKANDVSIKAFNDLLPFIKVGVTERQIANELDRLAKLHGAEKASFDTIVASGVNSAKPHGTASDKALAAGELVTIDFGYYVDGYTSDITRTLAIGDVDAELVTIYNTVRQAKLNAVDTVKSGISGAEVDKVARDIIVEAGYAEAFNHSTGHGVGLNIHEGPALSARSSDELLPGHLLTIEPGIYLTGKGGVRIEDDVIVTATGYENLTAALSDELIVIEA